MLTVEESIVIDRPREEVWDFVTEPSNFPVWMSSVIEFEPEGTGELEVGDRARQVLKVAGRRIESVKEVTDRVPAERFSFGTAEGPFPDSVTFAFGDVEGGTRMRVRGETPGLGGVFGRLSEPLVTRMFRRDLRSGLENLKTLLEGQD